MEGELTISINIGRLLTMRSRKNGRYTLGGRLGLTLRLTMSVECCVFRLVDIHLKTVSVGVLGVEIIGKDQGCTYYDAHCLDNSKNWFYHLVFQNQPNSFDRKLIKVGVGEFHIRYSLSTPLGGVAVFSDVKSTLSRCLCSLLLTYAITRVHDFFSVFSKLSPTMPLSKRNSRQNLRELRSNESIRDLKTWKAIGVESLDFKSTDFASDAGHDFHKTKERLKNFEVVAEDSALVSKLQFISNADEKVPGTPPDRKFML
ncbi:hypothetical protein CLF_108447 [Clonorchis sinensis]|uniref:Uncharacterized protein n=1 Tax=Clonorchis sinensis TaxID=79923 RepID=G7YRM6_CLOSI|nr:hypothetical protein CLF_108447 [Clonorchis sinensis]